MEVLKKKDSEPEPDPKEIISDQRDPKCYGPFGSGTLTLPEHFPGNDCPIPKAGLPELGSIALGDPKLIAGVKTLGEDGLELAEHMAEDQTELGQVPPIVGVLVEQALLPLLEQLDGLFALFLQVLDENFEVFVTI